MNIIFVFYHTSLKGCRGIVFTHAVQMGWQVGGVSAFLHSELRMMDTEMPFHDLIPANMIKILMPNSLYMQDTYGRGPRENIFSSNHHCYITFSYINFALNYLYLIL